MNRRRFVRASVGGVGVAASLRGRGWGDEAAAVVRAADVPGACGEVLYNGIRPPSAWPPPQLTPLPNRRGELPRDPPALPSYLVTPPAVIPIDVGRQGDPIAAEQKNNELPAHGCSETFSQTMVIESPQRLGERPHDSAEFRFSITALECVFSNQALGDGFREGEMS